MSERTDGADPDTTSEGGTLGPLLELLALTGIAIAQPLFDLFGRSGERLVARQASRVDIVVFALVVTFLPALVVWACELLAGLVDRRLRRAIHFAAVACLIAVIASLVLKRNTDFGYKILPPTVSFIGLVLALAFFRWTFLRTFTRYLAAGSLAFLALFLFSSPTSAIVLKGGSVDPAEVTVGNPAPVVMLVFDELSTVSLMNSEGRIDADLYPNFAALADDSQWYRNNTTVAPITNEALPALLTGRYPKGDGILPVIGEYPDNLFTLLGDSYSMNVVEQHTGLCPEQLCADTAITSQEDAGHLLGEAFDLWRVMVEPRNLAVPPPELANLPFDHRVEGSRDFIAAMSAGATAQLDFMHLNLPHVAFEFLPDGTRYEGARTPRGTFAGRWWSRETAAAARQRHLLQTQFTDLILGRVLDRLRTLDRYDDSLIVVSADHGTSFRSSNPRRTVTEENYPDLVWTPLIIKQPGRHPGAVVDDPVRAIDVLPTIAEVLDVELPWEVDGRSVLGPRRPAEEGDPRVLGTSSLNSLELPEGEDFLTLDGERGFAEVLRSGLPGEGDESDLRLYRLPPYGGLVGRRTDELEEAAEGEGAPRLRGRLERPAGYREVDLDSGMLPAYVSGVVQHPGQGRATVAVSVNGVVGGWSRAYFPGYFPNEIQQEPGVHLRRFWAMVPPSLFREGENDIELHFVEGEPGSERLTPIRLPS